jgi:signal transduction histidine kinase
VAGLWVGLFGFLLLGGLFPLRTSPRRSAYHLRNSAALAAFLIMGPEALLLILPSAVAAALLPFRFIHLDSDASVGRVIVRRVEDYGSAARSVLLDTVFLTGGVLIAHGYYGSLLTGTYPVPLDGILDLLVYMTVAFTSSAFLALFSESYFRFASRRPTDGAAGSDIGLLPDDAPLYGLILTIGSPLQMLAHVLYLFYGTVPFLFGLSTFVIFVLVHSLLLQRRRRFSLLLQDLEVSQRLAALGELTGRIVHQTRHQLGLIGVTVHLIRDAIDGGDPLPRERIRRELDRLEGVSQTLREMLAGDLVDAESSPPRDAALPTTLLGLVRREVDFLQEKARRRRVVVTVEEGEDETLHREPRELQRLAEGIFNVLENAIAAATSAVSIRLERKAPQLLLVVCDDGAGIEPSFLPRACEPFTTTKKDGTGMGLAIALSAARLFGGDVTLENEPGGGLRVSFRLPQATDGASERSETAKPGI